MQSCPQGVEEKDDEIAELNESLKSLKEDLAAAYEEIWTSEQEQNEMANRVRELDIRAGKVQASLNEAYEDLDVAMTENEELKTRLKQSINECQALREAKELAEASLQATEKNIQSFQNILSETKEEMEYLSAEKENAMLEQQLYGRPISRPRSQRQVHDIISSRRYFY